jgi:hypothetical protein
MTAKTDKQLDAAKKEASPAPAAKKAAIRARKSADNTRGTAATKAAEIPNQPDQKGDADDETPENEKPQTGTTEWVEEKAEEVAASGTETTNGNDAIENAHGSSDEGAAKSNGAKSSSSSGSPVKRLTEAGKKRLVNKLLGLAETQATQGSFKITPADLIRLMQLHKEMTPQRDRKVTVQWIEDKPE